MSSTVSPPVRQRRVFYIPGYDPFPPRRYRELYRKEASKQAEYSGYDIVMKPGLDTGEGFGWRVAAMVDGQPVRSDIEVLVWSDIVQNSRPNSVLATYADMLRTVWTYTSTGAFFRLMRLRKGPVIAALYPVVALLTQAGVAIGLAWAMVRIVLAMVGEIAPNVSVTMLWLFAVAMAVLVALFVLRWFRDNDGKFFAYYLMHDFAFTASKRGAYPQELETRLAMFQAQIAEALESDADEVLVVGHSSGAHLVVSILSDLIRAKQLRNDGPALAFLSLGQVVPMVSFLPEAKRLRRDLIEVSQSDNVCWVDVTAPGDGCCFALCNPVAVSGLDQGNSRYPLVFSAAFTQSLSPARWKALRWRFFRLHFQYLCAFDRPKDYDYFQITAGPQRLTDRYADRTSSRSQIVKAINPYTSTL